MKEIIKFVLKMTGIFVTIVCMYAIGIGFIALVVGGIIKLIFF